MRALQFVASRPIESRWLPIALAFYGRAMLGAGAVAVLPRRFEEPKPASMLNGLWLYPRGRAAAELANNRKLAFEQNVPRQARCVMLIRRLRRPPGARCSIFDPSSHSGRQHGRCRTRSHSSRLLRRFLRFRRPRRRNLRSGRAHYEPP